MSRQSPGHVNFGGDYSSATTTYELIFTSKYRDNSILKDEVVGNRHILGLETPSRQGRRR
jgi:hypothetical protein